MQVTSAPTTVLTAPTASISCVTSTVSEWDDAAICTVALDRTPTSDYQLKIQSSSSADSMIVTHDDANPTGFIWPSESATITFRPTSNVTQISFYVMGVTEYAASSNDTVDVTPIT